MEDANADASADFAVLPVVFQQGTTQFCKGNTMTITTNSQADQEGMPKLPKFLPELHRAKAYNRHWLMAVKENAGEAKLQHFADKWLRSGADFGVMRLVLSITSRLEAHREFIQSSSHPVIQLSLLSNT